VFDCNIKKISSPVESKVDDELAKSMGATDLKDLKSKVENQMQSEYSDLTKNLDKKVLFEKLQSAHKFELPEDLINVEFQNLSTNYLNSQSPSSIDHQKEIKDKKLTSDNEAKFKEDAKNRIELGLILQEVGKVNEISVTPEEMNKALFEYASNFKGQEQKVIDYYRNNQDAAMQLQAPLYENKIVDFILSKVKLKKKDVDVDSFIKMYNNVNSVEKTEVKKKTAKKKIVKKKTKK
jgi:trigger factor